MPLYEYQCRACGHRFEVIQKFSDAPLSECPRCKGEVEKLISSPAFQFKGTGWYVTDYAKKSGSPSSDTKSETKSESGGSDSKSDSAAKDSSPAKSAGDASSTTAKSSSSGTP